MMPTTPVHPEIAILVLNVSQLLQYVVDSLPAVSIDVEDVDVTAPTAMVVPLPDSEVYEATTRVTALITK